MLINIASKDASDCSSQDLENAELDEDLDEAILSHLTWMKRLKSLVILLDSLPPPHVSHVFILDWLREEGADSLERLWVTAIGMDSGNLFESGLLDLIRGPTVKSAGFTNDFELQSHSVEELDDDRYLQLEHLSSICFDFWI